MLSQYHTHLLTTLLLFLHTKPLLASLCVPSTFSNLILPPSIKLISLSTTSYTNLSLAVPASQNHYTKNITALSACELIITHTHTGLHDSIVTTIWLPLSENWTGRFLGAGGGGYSTGVEDPQTLPWAASEGFAVASTNGGHSATATVSSWALASPGNLNWNLIQDFASTSLLDAAVLGKAAAKAYYGRDVSKSYWNGCSTGGRQGHMMAQRFPGVYDGVLASAPGINWSQVLMSIFWPQAIMNEMGVYPTSCEIDAIRLVALDFCDSHDGLQDGIPLNPSSCPFNASSLVGQTLPCSPALTNTSVKITAPMASLVEQIWAGPHFPSGNRLWYGLERGAFLGYVAGTTCSQSNTQCTGTPLSVAADWITNFLLADPSSPLSNINTSTYTTLLHTSQNIYASILDTSDPDLSSFAAAGGKLIVWHGLADQLVPPGGTRDYVKRVYDADVRAAEYYRYFEAPGVEHCVGGKGWYPGGALEQLIRWVEEGEAPETLSAKGESGEGVGVVELCAWPRKLVYGGVKKGFGCA